MFHVILSADTAESSVLLLFGIKTTYRFPCYVPRYASVRSICTRVSVVHVTLQILPNVFSYDSRLLKSF